MDYIYIMPLIITLARDHSGIDIIFPSLPLPVSLSQCSFYSKLSPRLPSFSSSFLSSASVVLFPFPLQQPLSSPSSSPSHGFPPFPPLPPFVMAVLLFPVKGSSFTHKPFAASQNFQTISRIESKSSSPFSPLNEQSQFRERFVVCRHGSRTLCMY